jgi:hypothetical protein
MKSYKRSIKFAVPLAGLLLLGATAVGLTQRSSVDVTRAAVCVKDNGQMRMLVGSTTCDPSERLVEWVVGGEVTAVQTGQGLIGTRDGGTVQLAIDPALVGTGGSVFAGFNDGPGDINGNANQLAAADRIGRLDLPAGNFVILAKMILRNLDSNDDRSHPVRCKLVTFEQNTTTFDFDEATVVVEDEQDRNDNGVPDRDGASSLVMSLMVVGRLAEPGGAALFCADGTPPNEEFGIPGSDGDVKYEDLKIIAIKTSSISNVFLNN